MIINFGGGGSSGSDTTVSPATTAPKMDGTAAVGTSAKYAREDHVHPSDTTKVDKVTGKGLSTNDYTTDEKNKLAGIAAGAEVNVQSDWNQATTSADDYIKNKPTLGTAAAKNYDTTVTTGSANLITSGAVASAIGAADAMRFKGTIGTGGTVTALPSTHQQGDTYRVITAGTYAGQTCEVGDLIIALGTSGTTASDWTVAQTNIDGAITSISGTAPISVTGSGSSRTVAISAASGSAAGSMSSAHYTKLEGIATGAEVNQNAFSNVQANNSSGTSLGTIAADSKTDTLTIQAGSNVTLTADTTNDKLTIASTNTDTKNTAGSTDTSSKIFLIGATSQAANPQTYSHDTAYVGTDGCLYSGGTKVLTAHQTYTQTTGKPTANQTPGFGSTFTISQISQSTTGQITATDRTVKIPDTTATTSAAGLMSAADKSKLNNAARTTTATITAGQTTVVSSVAFDSVASYVATMNGEEVLVDMVVAEDTQDELAEFSIAAAQSSAIAIKIIY